MSRHVLIAGPATRLASHLCARLLSSSEDTVFLFLSGPDGSGLDGAEAAARVRHAAQALAPEGEGEDRQARWGSRLHLLPVDFAEALASREASLPFARLDEAWYVSAGCSARGMAGGALLRQLLDALPRFGRPEFNHVGPVLVAGSDPDGGTLAALAGAAERDVETRCAALGVGYRLFQLDPVIGGAPLAEAPVREGFELFLAALHDLQAELDERLPEYLGSRALRCLAPTGASLGLIPVGPAVDHLLRESRSRDTLFRRLLITAPERTPFADLCARVGSVHGVRLLTVEQVDALNAVDRTFHERLAGFQDLLTPPGAPGAREPLSDLRLDAEAEVALFRNFRQGLEAARVTRRTRAAALLGSLEPRTLDRDGASLSYYAAGSARGGPPLVVLNALGQGLQYWGRLLDALLPRHRVIVWEPRSTGPGPRPLLLRDQVDDLEAVLRHEGIETCHLVCWCTGPKVAVEFYLRRPSAVASMVFLNATFKCVGGPKDFDTSYERNFEPLCGILDRRPAMAASVLKSLRLSLSKEDGDLGDESDVEAADRLLARMNRDLRPHVLAPFRDEAVVVNYARQLLDFWALDSRKAAPQVQVPVLLLSAEHDGVASPEHSRQMAGLLPDARHVHVEGATHYCLYDRPEFVAGHLEAFFQSLHPAPGLPPKIPSSERNS
ncbi:alpha/beta hydrolase [Corallococcus sp. CA053C]|uniref:alpha/beta fold hydrolase n=1 Tax=Corallococcus sp. CA053C TaxID=2316732 RepID=UPI000EA19DA8|nr:alpha/beta hydrolase [Corallococcus sp. CA053C]RKH05136.1 alpha/beta hydrolase [Corallococcus sp. CA053C]